MITSYEAVKEAIEQGQTECRVNGRRVTIEQWMGKQELGPDESKWSAEAWAEICVRGVDYRGKWNEERGFNGGDLETDTPIFHLKPGLSRIESAVGTAKIPLRVVDEVPVKGIVSEWHKERGDWYGKAEHADGIYSPKLAIDSATQRAINYGAWSLHQNSCEAMVTKSGVTRSILLNAKDLESANKLAHWLKNGGFDAVRKVTPQRDPFCEVMDYEVFQVGEDVHLRMEYFVADAMGMNMATQQSQDYGDTVIGNFVDKNVKWWQLRTKRRMKKIRKLYEELGIKFISVSSNMCSDKKQNTIDMTLGRGETVDVVCELSEDFLNSIGIGEKDGVRGIEKVYNYFNEMALEDTERPVYRYNAIGKIIAGFFVHGQDLAQTVESSMAVQKVSLTDNTVKYTLQLPSLLIATFGGGTSFNPLANEYLDEFECKGFNKKLKFAEIIGATAAAGELGYALMEIGGDEATIDDKISYTEIPVGMVQNGARLGTFETALVAADNAGMSLIKKYSEFDTEIEVLREYDDGSVEMRASCSVTIPSAGFEANTRHYTNSIEMANLIQGKCYVGSIKAGGVRGSENTNIANTVAGLQVGQQQPLYLIRQNSCGTITPTISSGGDLNFKVTLHNLRLYPHKNYSPVELAEQLYMPVVTSLELQTNRTQAAGTLAKSHSRLTGKKGIK